MRVPVPIFCATLGAWLLSACTLLNAPDRKLLVDAGADTGPGGEICDDGVDNDGDDRIDCADFDCSESAVCCDQRATELEEAWVDFDEWSFAPTEASNGWVPDRSTTDGERVLSGFPDGTFPRAVVGRSCVPMALGLDLNLGMRPRGDARCTSDRNCDVYAALVLSTVRDMSVGAPLLDELAVRVYAGGFIEVTQAGAVLATSTAEMDLRSEVRVELLSDRDDEGRPLLFGRVLINDEIVLDNFALGILGRLVRTGKCEQVPGLFVAVEGRASGVEVGRLHAASRDCATPSQFTRTSATLSSEILDFNPSWTSGSLGSPTLASSQTSPTGVRWDIVVDGSNDPPELEQVAHVGYALGHAFSTTSSGASPWSGSVDDWRSSMGVKYGDDPPSCVGGSCDERVSAREPHVLRVNGSTVLTFVREIDTDAGRDRFGVHIVNPLGDPDDSLPNVAPALEPDDLLDCVNIRDPALIQADPDASQGYWLFFRCVRSAPQPAEIHAVKLTSTFVVDDGDGAPIQIPVLSNERLGAFASAGVRSPEPVIAFRDDGGAVLRLWFLGRDGSGRVGVGLAEAVVDDIAQLDSDLPQFNPSPLNPVLTENASVLGLCPTLCRIEGLAIAAWADNPERLRFLLARRVNLFPEGALYELLPLDQPWVFQ